MSTAFSGVPTVLKWEYKTEATGAYELKLLIKAYNKSKEDNIQLSLIATTPNRVATYNIERTHDFFIAGFARVYLEKDTVLRIYLKYENVDEKPLLITHEIVDINYLHSRYLLKLTLLPHNTNKENQHTILTVIYDICTKTTTSYNKSFFLGKGEYANIHLSLLNTGQKAKVDIVKNSYTNITLPEREVITLMMTANAESHIHIIADHKGNAWVGGTLPRVSAQ